MLLGPSRAELDALARVLALRAVACELAGAREDADALVEAARRYAALSPQERQRAAARLRREADAGEWPAAARETLAAALRTGAGAALAGQLDLLPADLSALLQSGELDPLDVVVVHRRHGAVTAADVAAVVAATAPEAAADGAHQALRRLAAHLPALAPRRRRTPLGRAVSLFERVEVQIAALPGTLAVEALGSLRRVSPTVGDVDVLLVHPDPAGALAAAVSALAPARVHHHGRTRAVLRLEHGELGLRSCRPERAGAVRLWHTGSAAHVEGLRRLAVSQGLSLRPDGLFDGGGRLVAADSEAHIYERLGLPLIAPELRHGEDEIARAAAGRLPSLLDACDIRGDLHTHTLWSDGRDSVDAMVFAARRLGYEYVAITDHSPSAAATRVLTLDRLRQQAADVARLRTAVPGLTILHGVEVDILADGSLDLPDEVMAGLDIVLASLHESFGHSPARLLERYARAMRHPMVAVVTHPANRVPGRDEGYALDFEALFHLAAETGTAVEVDGGPGHLDLDGHLARRAVEAGATLTVDSDAHDAHRLGRQMRLGVGTARRGGVSAAHVLNTRGVEDVRAFVAAKRQRR